MSTLRTMVVAVLGVVSLTVVVLVFGAQSLSTDGLFSAFSWSIVAIVGAMAGRSAAQTWSVKGRKGNK